MKTEYIVMTAVSRPKRGASNDYGKVAVVRVLEGYRPKRINQKNTRILSIPYLKENLHIGLTERSMWTKALNEAQGICNSLNKLPEAMRRHDPLKRFPSRVYSDATVSKFKTEVLETGNVAEAARRYGMPKGTAQGIASGKTRRNVAPVGSVYEKEEVGWDLASRARHLKCLGETYKGIEVETGIAVGTAWGMCTLDKEAHRPPNVPRPERLLFYVLRYGEEAAMKRLGWDRITLGFEVARAKKEVA